MTTHCRIHASRLGRCVRASRHFGRGARVGRMTGRASVTPARLTIQTSRFRHMIPVIPWRFLNHSCEPSCDVRMERIGLVLVARRDLGPGDELTFDYATTEWKVASRFRCRCAAATCRSRLVGYSGLAADERKKIAERALPYLRRIRWIEGAGNAQ